MNKIIRRVVSGLVLLFMLLIGWGMMSPFIENLRASVAPIHQNELAQDRIYAYRSWQSVGIYLNKGDLIEIHASGEWLYTPDDYHGPQGHPRFLAPSFYPLSGPGGALIMRVGEKGRVSYVGRHTYRQAERAGVLYLQINDDILSDNDGFVTLDVQITREDEFENSTSSLSERKFLYSD